MRGTMPYKYPTFELGLKSETLSTIILVLVLFVHVRDPDEASSSLMA